MIQKLFQYLVISLLFLGGLSGQSQVVDMAGLDLLPGEYINDVVYSPFHDCYIVVGNFTQINGISRKNIAFLQKSNLSVLNTANVFPIDATGGIDGEIRAVAITSNYILPTSTISLYIGGNFSTVTKSGTNYTRYGIAKFTCTKPIAGIPGNFSVSSWNADLDMTPLLSGYGSEGIDDILITGDTVIFSGKFWATNNSTTYDLRDGVAAYKVSGSLLNYPTFASTGTYIQSRYFHLDKKGSNLYVSGYINLGGANNGRFFKLDASGNILPGFTYDYGGLKGITNFAFFEDSLIMVNEMYGSPTTHATDLVVCRQADGSEKTNHSLFVVTGGSFGGVGGSKTSMQFHNDHVFVCTTQPGYSVISYGSEGEGPVVSTPDWNGNATSVLTDNLLGNIHIAGNRLFVSATNLASLNGQTKNRLGAYCIEPHNPGNFYLPDTMVCAEDNITYSIDMVDFADGYRWEYSGNGADFGADGNVETGPYDVVSNAVSVLFTPAFSPGILSVTPYTLCNGTTKVFSNTVSINIHSNPLPHVEAGVDTTLTCARDSVTLFGYSDSVVVSYEWVYNFPDPNIPGQYHTVYDPGNYVFKVKTAAGCPAFDTVLVYMDTIAPVVLPPIGPYELTCLQPAKDFTATTLSNDASLSWYDPASGDTSDLATLNVSIPGDYYCIATDTTNGCTDVAGILVYLNQLPPNVVIAGYPVLNVSQPLDTLTCFEPVFNLTCYSDTANTTADWINSDTTQFFGSTLTITSGGNYYILVTNTVNGCSNSLGINISESMNLPEVTVPANGLLNCSIDSLQLLGSSINTGVFLEWTGSGIMPSDNPVTIYDQGTYYLTVTDPENGCEAEDSVVVTADSSINVFAGNDTLICNKEIVSLEATYEGTIGGIIYLWNNGTVGSFADYEAGAWPYAAVEVWGDGGCYGADTVYLQLPPDVQVDIEGFKACSESASGQLVITPLAGAEPFFYSLNQGPDFQSAPVFGGLVSGDYTVLVRDSLGCDYLFSSSIDQNSSLPVPEFLFSTYNFVSDTVAIIDVSNPPTDSVNWIFPSGLVLLESTDFPLILLPDTGVFEITMQAYYGDCLSELSKLLYAAPYDSLVANYYNSNGIKSVEIYPNPTSGDFTVHAEFYHTQRAVVLVQDMAGTICFQQVYDEALVFTQPVSLDPQLIGGPYILRVIGEFDSVTETFILAR